MRPRRKPSKRRKDAISQGYRSGLELDVAEALERDGCTDFEYETWVIEYDRPQQYKPDFILPNGIIIEAKGRFESKDRTKHLLVREQHPDLDIRFVFAQDNPLNKGSKSRYSDWCQKHGFQYAFLKVPKEWLK